MPFILNIYVILVLNANSKFRQRGLFLWGPIYCVNTSRFFSKFLKHPDLFFLLFAAVSKRCIPVFDKKIVPAGFLFLSDFQGSGRIYDLLGFKYFVLVGDRSLKIFTC